MRLHADDYLAFSAALLAVAFLFFFVGDAKGAAWVGAAGALSALAAIFWREDR